MKRILIVFLCFLNLFMCFGCNKTVAMTVDNIDWQIMEAVIDGKKTVVMSYKNNSSFVVNGVEIQFKLKDNLTKDELAIFDKYNLSQDEVSDLYISAYNYYFVEKGKKSPMIPCNLVGTWNYCHSIEEYNLMEPKTINVSYIKGDKMYGITYDFKTDTTLELTEEGIEIFEWSENDLATLIPRPEKKMVKVGFDWSDNYSFTVYDITEQDFEKYIDSCKSLGFTNAIDENDYFGYQSYKAKNNDGVELHIYYHSFDDYTEPCQIEVSVKR